MVRATVWNEYRHERSSEEVREVYPDGIHETIARQLDDRGHDVATATLDEPDNGLSESVLDRTEVLLWWGHEAHDEVRDDVVDAVKQRVLEGMGLIVLHSGHFSKIFKELMGTSCALTWRENDEEELLWTIEPGHPIAEGIDECVRIPRAETYGERFDVPAPDELVFASTFEGGELFRSGCCYTRGNGRIFYFRPGHETYPIYERESIATILDNAVEWAAPSDAPAVAYGNEPPARGQ